MAARAGAKTVVSCEAIGLIARQAQEIVARNQLGDRLKIVSKPSTELVLGEDLPARAGVLITETFSSNVLDEGILSIIEDAHRRLLAPDAIIIPRVASARGFLIGGGVLRDMLFVEKVKGFALDPFNEFAPRHLVVPLDSVPHEVMSEEVELLRFDLASRQFPMMGRECAVTATTRGFCLGLAQWIELELDEQTTYRNRPVPGGNNTHWPNIVYRFPSPIAVEPGDAVRLIVRHDRSEIDVALAGE
jgi:type II protein arginine methyltransferase